jgi:hypothetical protein
MPLSDHEATIYDLKFEYVYHYITRTIFKQMPWSNSYKNSAHKNYNVDTHKWTK